MINVFISHASTDSEIAAKFVRLLEESFNVKDGEIRCTSTDGYQLPISSHFADTLRVELKTSKVIIGLISANALQSQWVMFELGLAWGLQNAPVLPVLLGLKPDDLPGPLKQYIAAQPMEINDVGRFLDQIYELTGWERRTHTRLMNASWGFKDEIKAYIAALSNSKNKMEGTINELCEVLSRSKFGQRLCLEKNAKKRLAEYCIHNDFWRTDDIVFIESGTIPVYLMLELINHKKNWPKGLLTNNIFVAIAGATDFSNLFSRTDIIHALEQQSNVMLLGGSVLEDYSATIPEDIYISTDDLFSNDLLNTCDSHNVNHLIMMVTRLTPEEGPCAGTYPTRNFKRSIMKYVLDKSTSRLSILLEADKLVARSGEPVDKHLWKKLKETRRVTLLCAVSGEMQEGDYGLLRRRLKQLEGDGVRVILVENNHVNN